MQKFNRYKLINQDEVEEKDLNLLKKLLFPKFKKLIKEEERLDIEKIRWKMLKYHI